MLAKPKVSTYTIIKGLLLDETYAALANWDESMSKTENMEALREQNLVGASNQGWLRDVSKVISARLDPTGRDMPLTLLAKKGIERPIWEPIYLWHITRDEFLVRNFFVEFLYPEYTNGTYLLRLEDALKHLGSLKLKGRYTDTLTEQTAKRVAGGLFSIANEMGMMKGKINREFSPYHLPDESFLYVLHSIFDVEQNPVKTVHSPEWKLFLMSPEDVERELFRLHQFQKVEYEVAGSIASLKLPHESALEYVRSLP